MHAPAQNALDPAPLMRIALTLGSSFHSFRRRLISTAISIFKLLRAFSLFRIIFLAFPKEEEIIGEEEEQKERLRIIPDMMKTKRIENAFVPIAIPVNGERTFSQRYL